MVYALLRFLIWYRVLGYYLRIGLSLDGFHEEMIL